MREEVSGDGLICPFIHPLCGINRPATNPQDGYPQCKSPVDGKHCQREVHYMNGGAKTK